MSGFRAGEGGSGPGLWAPPAPGKLIGPGHAIGDFLQADRWDVLEKRTGCLRVLASLPSAVMNLREELFGGFAPTYVDFVALHTWWAGQTPRPGHPWLATLSLRCEYFAPIRGPHVVIEGRVLSRSGSTSFIEVRFVPAEGAGKSEAFTQKPKSEAPPGNARSPGDELLVYATATLKAL